MESANSPCYERFLAKVQELSEWFHRPDPANKNRLDPNCIEVQVQEMVWDGGSYRVIEAARAMAKNGSDGRPEVSTLLHGLLDRCFFESFAMSIRRLLDARSDVYSLARVLDEVAANSHLFTRANMLQIREFPYDYEKVRTDLVKANPPSPYIGQMVGHEFFRCELSKQVHEDIDKLCGVTPDRRSPCDSICRSIVTQMRNSLEDQKEKVVLWVNKFVAHSSTSESRTHARFYERVARPDDLWKAQEMICKAATFVNAFLLCRFDGSFLAEPTYNHLAHMQTALVSPEQVGALRATWDSYRKEVDSWSRYDKELPFHCES